MINTRELCRMYAKTYGVSIKYSESIVNSVFDLVKELLYDEKQDIQIRKFGTLKHKLMKEKRVRHPATGELFIMPERDVVKFIPSETLTEEDE